MVPDDAEIVACIKRVMETQKVSMRFLSERTRIPYRSLQNYLRGESRMPAAALLAIMETLRINSDYLVRGDFLPPHAVSYDAALALLPELASAVLEADRAGLLAKNSWGSVTPPPTGTPSARAAQELAARLAAEYALEVDRRRTAAIHERNETGLPSPTVRQLEQKRLGPT